MTEALELMRDLDQKPNGEHGVSFPEFLAAMRRRLPIKLPHEHDLDATLAGETVAALYEHAGLLDTTAAAASRSESVAGFITRSAVEGLGALGRGISSAAVGVLGADDEPRLDGDGDGQDDVIEKEYLAQQRRAAASLPASAFASTAPPLPLLRGVSLDAEVMLDCAAAADVV